MVSNRINLLILAKSKKKKNTCIAGVWVDLEEYLFQQLVLDKEPVYNEVFTKQLGDWPGLQWIRPIDKDYGNAISDETLFVQRTMIGTHENEVMIAEGRNLELLDIISIPISRHTPSSHQKENYIIDNSEKWHLVSDPFSVRTRTDESDYEVNYKSHLIEQLKDLVQSKLDWPNLGGKNDRVRINTAVNYSLALIKTSLTIKVIDGKLRGEFSLDGIEYNLSITDQNIIKNFSKKGGKNYQLGQCFMCISLGEEFHYYYYKLIASVFIINY